jgi:hypothetical protein
MTGNLYQLARQDAAKIVTAGGFQVTAVISTPDNSVSLTVTGLGTGTWVTFDDLNSGKIVNSSSNSITIPETQLIAAAYPYTKNGRPNLIGHKVVLANSTGTDGTYKISEQHPNATLGLMVCIISRDQ